MDLAVASFHMWATFLVIACAILLYATERFSVEVISLGVLAGLMLLFQFAPLRGSDGLPLVTTGQLLSGLAHPALITILALMVIGQGMSRTAAFAGPTAYLLRRGRHRPKLLIFVCLLLVMAISAFLNDTPVVVMFLPIMIVLSEKLRQSPGRVLMPLSFAAILGGMTTLIGTSTNLLTAGAYQSITGETIGFFDFTAPGMLLAATGLAYLWIFGPFLLKPRADRQGASNPNKHGRHFIAELTVGPQSPWLGTTATAGMFPCFPGMTVRLIHRDSTTILPPFDDLSLQPGDRVTLAATLEDLHGLVSDDPMSFIPDNPHTSRNQDVGAPQPSGGHLFEVLLPPASVLDGRPLKQRIDPALIGGIIVGIQRRTRMLRTGLGDIRLQAGDVLLVYGSVAEMRSLRSSRDVILLEWSGRAVPDLRKRWAARTIFLATVIVAASGLLPLVIAALTGALLMIACRCLTIQEASRAINRQVFLLVGAALAMGTALAASGGAAYLAHGLLTALADASPAIILSALFLLIAAVSNILSNNTTAILFTPIAVDMAMTLGLPTLPFIVTVIFAANCSFATPVSYQTNLLVMAPGGYRFTDYMRLGIPLILLLWAVFSLVVPLYYGL
ncbi:SLC13 family permease [Kordiimonas lacus]|uniref:Di-and tricarboxylate transporter n=1 Tax=Kordiimonas lacus TaxID=637679 RepID=A0A1G6ZJF7_9PROT|nr:SLC13 family permease [Kordiimonas lacus]SDE01676.1 Di-and tricarboxylate transporter [Kordiimonas lacus]